MHLNELKVGQSGVLNDFSSAGQKHQTRYMSLGLIPGSKVSVIRIAPAGCPWQIKVGSTLLSIRRSEAQEILVGDVK